MKAAELFEVFGQDCARCREIETELKETDDGSGIWGSADAARTYSPRHEPGGVVEAVAFRRAKLLWELCQRAADLELPLDVIRGIRASVSADMADVLTMRYALGMPFNKIGVALGVSNKTARRRHDEALNAVDDVGVARLADAGRAARHQATKRNGGRK